MLSREYGKQIKETNECKKLLDLKINNLEKENYEMLNTNNILEQQFQQKAKECLQLTQNLQAARDQNEENLVEIKNQKITKLEKNNVKLSAELNIALKEKEEVEESKIFPIFIQ